MKKCTLFIGNGLNRINHDDRSWTDVVQELARFAGKKVDKKDARPFPLLYEDLFIHYYAKAAGKEDDFKKYIASLMYDMKPNHLHDQIKSAEFDHIITTNYDYCIEDTLDKRPESKGSEEIRYSLNRRQLSGKTSIWHIHGEIIDPKTINLGHEHYAGALSGMRDFTLLNTVEHPHSAFRQGKIDFDTPNNLNKAAWIDVFLRDDIHIVGFGLDYCEIDLWWLLVVKERLKWGAFDTWSKKLEVGKTYYYYADINANKNLNSALDSLGVQCAPIPLINDNWTKFYGDALNMIMTRKEA